jgi:hypothetical protein
LVLAQFERSRVVIYNAFIQEEHPDNRRFLADCERWFGHPITVVKDEKYGASVHEVWRRKRVISHPQFTPCSYFLKRETLEAQFLEGDIHVYGYTADETHRARRFDGCGWIFPLIERNLSHADCLSMIERAGIQLPEMYRLGFNNANCIGCCRGGEGYWNKVREVFPDRFAQVVQIQESIGPTSYLFRNRKTQERFGLKDLPLVAGRHDEELPSCSFFCALAEEEL